MVIRVDGEKKYFYKETISEDIHISNNGTLILYECTINGSLFAHPTSVVKIGGNVSINGPTASFKGCKLVFGLSEEDRQGMTKSYLKYLPSPTTYTNQTTYTASIGGVKLERGDWVEVFKAAGYSHHTIYVGNGKFIGRNTGGIIYDDKSCIEGKSGRRIYCGGEAAASWAESCLGNKGYNLILKNCEDFASECCGGYRPPGPSQVQMGGLKALALAGGVAASVYNSSDTARKLGLFGIFSIIGLAVNSGGIGLGLCLLL